MVLALFAASLSGCGSPDDARVEPATAPPMPELPAATPDGIAMDTAAQPNADDARDAGMGMVAARDVCRLPVPALARFAAYSEWVVQGDAQRKAVFVGAAKEAAEQHASMIRQGRQETYRKATCERVRRILAALEQADATERAGSAR
jgi:hypothetical protein